MHDLSLKPGSKTSEFATLVVTTVVQWVSAVLLVLTEIGPNVPDKYQPYVLLVVSVLTSVQAVFYNLQRGKLKRAAVEAVTGYTYARAAYDAVEAGVEPEPEVRPADAVE